MCRFTPISAYPGDNDPLVKILSRCVVRSKATIKNVLEDDRERPWWENVHRTKDVPNEANSGNDAGRLVFETVAISHVNRTFNGGS